jgi:hypothetical protein
MGALAAVEDFGLCSERATGPGAIDAWSSFTGLRPNNARAHSELDATTQAQEQNHDIALFQ